MPAIVYSCPLVPAEWIEAHGLTPLRVAPNCSDASVAPAPGMCPYARAFAAYAVSCDADAVVVTTACDQMRRAADVISRNCRKPLFLMNVPHTWQTETSRGLYVAELERLGRFLISLGGSVGVPAPRRSTQVPNHGRDLSSASGLPIALLGGPVPDSDEVFSLIERAGGYVALDGTETGERTRPQLIHAGRFADGLVGAIADAYFAIPDPFRRPNTRFYDWLGRGLRERGIRAVVLRRYVWCDTWRAEAERIREFAGLPFLEIEVAETGSDAERTLSRLQSLMETLK